MNKIIIFIAFLVFAGTLGEHTKAGKKKIKKKKKNQTGPSERPSSSQDEKKKVTRTVAPHGCVVFHVQHKSAGGTVLKTLFYQNFASMTWSDHPEKYNIAERWHQMCLTWKGLSNSGKEACAYDWGNKQKTRSTIEWDGTKNTLLIFEGLTTVLRVSG